MPRLLLLSLALATPTYAQTVTLGPGQTVMIGHDGRVLGHIPYPEVDPADLVTAPIGFAVGQPCRVHRDAVPDLTTLLDAARAAGLAQALRGVSCYRSVPHQRAVFCGPRSLCADAATRAHSVGPPGYSEHATGYAIDFGIRPQGICADVSDCIAATSAGRWLIDNATRYGFELSFPAGNAQGVTWEPWHWRWVGTSGDAPSAARARAMFARARAEFPASPGIVPLVIRVLSQPPLPVQKLKRR